MRTTPWTGRGGAHSSTPSTADLNVSISDQDRGLLLDWLVTKFGPTSKPFPRAYIPPQITTFSATMRRRRSSEGVHVVSRRGSSERREVQPRSMAGRRARHEAAGSEADRRGTGTPGRMAGAHEGDESESVVGGTGEGLEGGMGRSGTDSAALGTASE